MNSKKSKTVLLRPVKSVHTSVPGMPRKHSPSCYCGWLFLAFVILTSKVYEESKSMHKANQMTFKWNVFCWRSPKAICWSDFGGFAHERHLRILREAKRVWVRLVIFLAERDSSSGNSKLEPNCSEQGWAKAVSSNPKNISSLFSWDFSYLSGSCLILVSWLADFVRAFVGPRGPFKNL